MTYTLCIHNLIIYYSQVRVLAGRWWNSLIPISGAIYECERVYYCHFDPREYHLLAT